MTLSRLDAVIRECLARRERDLATVCDAVRKVHAGDLWREKYPTFVAWGKAAHGIGRTQLYAYLGAAGEKVPSIRQYKIQVAGRKSGTTGAGCMVQPEPARPTNVAGAERAVDVPPSSAKASPSPQPSPVELARWLVKTKGRDYCARLVDAIVEAM